MTFREPNLIRLKDDQNYLDFRNWFDADLNSSRTKFKKSKMLILVKLLAKYVTIIYALGSVHEKFGVWIKTVPKSFHSRNSRPRGVWTRLKVFKKELSPQLSQASPLMSYICSVPSRLHWPRQLFSDIGSRGRYRKRGLSFASGRKNRSRFFSQKKSKEGI